MEKQLIGRFLLGAGLGGLVGTGVLALLSVSIPGSYPQKLTAGSRPASEPAGVVVQPEVPAEKPADTPAQTPVDAPEVTQSPPEVNDAPIAADHSLAAGEEILAVPGSDLAATGSSPAGLEAGADFGAEPAPEAQLAPEAAPDVAGIPDLASEENALTAPSDNVDVPTGPVAETTSETPDAPASVAAAGEITGEDAPDLSDAPQPPPLTDEEELMLAQIAADALLEEAAPNEELPLLPAEIVPEMPVGDDFVILDELPVQVPPSGPEVADEAGAGIADAAVEAPVIDDATAADLADAGQQPAAQVPDMDAPDADVAAPNEPARVLTLEGSSALPGSSVPAGRASGVETNRLPRIGDDAGTAAEDSAGLAGEEAELPPADVVPRIAYARDFDNPAGKPRFAVILIDDGAADLDRQALADLPFAISFAIDPQLANASEIAQIYRAAGQEVVMMTAGLPKGASASDVAVAFDAMAHVLPEAVAAMDAPDRRFQADRPLSTLVVPEINGQGRGLITWDAGLNAANQIARREGIPSAVIFRNLDADGEAAPVIRRYLDRAAFKASQDGAVTVVGRAAHGETVVALLEWAVEGRADSVALAPASAMLAVD